MSLVNRTLAKLPLRHLVRLCSNTNPSDHFALFDFTPKFTTEEQEKILKILNQSNRDELKSLKVSQTKIKSLENYRNKKGPFKSIIDILEVDGLGVKILEKLCKQIISETPNSPTQNNSVGKKRLKDLIVPCLPPDSDITTAVGLHLAPMGVSWAKLCQKSNELEYWGYEDFCSLPKKMLPIDTFELAVKIVNQIPLSNVYVLEGTSSMGLQGQRQPARVTSHNQQLELASMLVALINTSSRHNLNCDKTERYPRNKVYFLRSKLPARLFNTLVGNERVSATTTIAQLIDGTESEFTLPCTRISLDQDLKSYYLSQSSPHKDLLGQALMLVIAFSDLCIRKNPVSLSAIVPGKKRNGL